MKIAVIEIASQHGLTHCQQDKIIAAIKAITDVYDILSDIETKISIVPNMEFDSVEAMHEYQRQ